MNIVSPQRRTARFVSTWQDDRLTGIKLAEHEDSSGWSLSFERVIAPTEKEREARQDAYCITTETGFFTYGASSAGRLKAMSS